METEPDLEHYAAKQLELSTYEGCVLWGNRVIVPQQGRGAVLAELHKGHPGITKLKSLARMYVWWPGINANIEKCSPLRIVPGSAVITSSCSTSTVDVAFLSLGSCTIGLRRSISRKGISHFDRRTFEVDRSCMCISTSSNVVIEELQIVFAKFGLPETIVIDNGTGFVSQEFETFLSGNSIKHVTSAPYLPASNGLAERTVQIVKRGLK